MSKIKLSESTFAVCPEGEHIFKITKVEHDEKFGTITVTLKTADGYIDTERYQLFDGQGEVVEGAIGAFSYLAKCAMGDQNLTEIDPLALKEKFVKATITHDKKPHRDDPNKTLIFTKISNIESSSEEEWNANAPKKAPVSNTTAQSPKKAAGFDLDALFRK